MARFEACLLDYGNTIVEFDYFQVTSILERLARRLSDLVAPTAVWTLRPAMMHVCALPHMGDPPRYRELSPIEQMQILLDSTYGGRAEYGPEIVAECDRFLQDFFVDSVALEQRNKDYLARLSARLRVGLVSNYPCGKAIRRSLERTGIGGLLDPIVISGEVGFVKPHPGPFQAALDQLATEPDRVLFVGDRWDMDMRGASQLGMKTCHHVGYTADLDLDGRYEEYRPDFTIERLEELDSVLFGSKT